MRTNLVAGWTVGALAVTGLAACSSDSDVGSDGGGSGTIEVTATDDACDLSETALSAGVQTFEVSNEGSQVTEFYVYAEGDRIMQEVENIGPGLSREMRVELPAGDYQGTCKPGMVGDGIRTDISVTGEQAEPLSETEELQQAAEDYSRYVESQSKSLITLTEQFVDAVKAGDVEQAKELFALARTPWERIEPVAEIFGGLDPAVDARVNDVAEGDEWTGYHRIERQLWVAGNTAGHGPDRRPAARRRAKRSSGSPSRSRSPRCSSPRAPRRCWTRSRPARSPARRTATRHTDLWDFAANVEGSKAAIAALRPVLEDRDPELLADIDDGFADVEALLAEQREGDGYVLYTDLSQDEIQQFADAVAALSESVSQVAAVVAGE